MIHVHDFFPRSNCVIVLGKIWKIVETLRNCLKSSWVCTWSYTKHLITCFFAHCLTFHQTLFWSADKKWHSWRGSLIVALPCWSTGMIQMRPPHSPCQGWPPLHQSPPAMWPAVHPGTQSQRVHWRRAGRRAGSLSLRNHRHIYERRQLLNILFLLWVHLCFDLNPKNIHKKIFTGLRVEWYWN